MQTTSITISNLNDIEIKYQDLLETAFNPGTPDTYAKYLQDLLMEKRKTAQEIGWELDSFSFMLNPVTGRITVWG